MKHLKVAASVVKLDFLQHLLQQRPPIPDGVEERLRCGRWTWNSGLMPSRRGGYPQRCDDGCGWSPAASQT
jgi:hypothetical protein